jgi:two-component system cell cycle response regulator DivK
LAQPPRNRFCVLLVDDDPDTREMYAMALKLSQFEVIEAADGHSALAAASEFLPDVVVTDLSGPNLDGFELLEWLRAHPETARIRALVLTGWADETTRGRALAAGAEFLLKPCLPETLLFQVFCALAKVAA